MEQVKIELLFFLYFRFDHLKYLRDSACNIVNMPMIFLSEHIMSTYIRGFHVIYGYLRKVTSTM
jgi:hypothetical protein